MDFALAGVGVIAVAVLCLICYGIGYRDGRRK